uniref:protein FAM151A isoform X1 n=2 Tax=Maylandia zebra TaxID=106582 RepID=UPI000D301609|nr:protein FAM151A isoform X1 [Maylandia zebra]XP_024657431.1 protein FAM151A-like isoform X1 [Maylandia zebra]XP_024657704.1 protein FAM151A-like isoform X1 [Maylandia zebra]
MAGEDKRRDERTAGGSEGKQNRMEPEADDQRVERGPKKRGVLPKRLLIMSSVAVVLIVLLTVIVVPVVLLTKTPAPSSASFSGGDMLEYLVQTGNISEADGLLATWFHRANSKEDMYKALMGDTMILEADVTLMGYGTPDEKPVPIMAHPPDIYSDNTLDEWLDAVLASGKGIKLDFKALESVGLSLDLLKQKESNKGINRPVWLNADILRGPNVPSFVAPVNGSRFLELIQDKFPDVTLSPGWKVLYIHQLTNETYSRATVEEMYNMIKDVPQRVTFPVHAMLVRSGWQHLSWLLNQSPRFSLTLWQGSVNPSVSDLLFVRDNTHPWQVYYDIYEPTLSEFKQAVGKQDSVRRFYPGGDLMEFLHPGYSSDLMNRLAVPLLPVTGRASLLRQLSGGGSGMLVVRVTSDSSRPGVLLVEGSGRSSELLTLQDVIQTLGQAADTSWGIYLRVQSQQLLEASLNLLQSAYGADELHRPVWISMEGLQSSDSTAVFVSTVERLFPYVTVVLAEHRWPPRIPAAVSQRVALHLNAASLPTGQEQLYALLGMMDKYDFIIEVDTKKGGAAVTVVKELRAQRAGRASRSLYILPQ